MRFRLDFLTTKKELPIEYRKSVMSFIKKYTEQANESIYKEYYDSCKKKNFSFAAHIPNLIINKDKILKEDFTFSILFTTSDIKLYYFFINAFQLAKYKPFKLENDNQMVLTHIQEINEPKIMQTVVVFKTKTPVCILKHEKGKTDVYYTSKDNAFLKILKEKYNIEFFDIKTKKVVVKHQGLTFETTSGIFMLKGNIKDLTKVYENGLGNRTGQGFGLLNLLS